MEMCGMVSTCMVHHDLIALEKAGFLRKPSRTKARGIEVVGGHWMWKPPESWQGECLGEITEVPGLYGMKCPICKHQVGDDDNWAGDKCLRCALAQEQKEGKG